MAMSSQRRRRLNTCETAGGDFAEVLGLFNNAAAREMSLGDEGWQGRE